MQIFKRFIFLISSLILVTFISCDETNQNFPNLVQFGRDGGTYIVSGDGFGMFDITDFDGNVLDRVCYKPEAEEQQTVTVDWLELTFISWSELKITVAPMHGIKSRLYFLDGSEDHWHIEIEIKQTCQ